MVRQHRYITVRKSIIKISALALALSSLQAFAEVKPAVIYDTAGKFDKSFSEAVYQNGVKVMAAEGMGVREFEPQNEAQREQGLRHLASRGFSPIVAVALIWHLQ